MLYFSFMISDDDCGSNDSIFSVRWINCSFWRRIFSSFLFFILFLLQSQRYSHNNKFSKENCSAEKVVQTAMLYNMWPFTMWSIAHSWWDFMGNRAKVSKVSKSLAWSTAYDVILSKKSVPKKDEGLLVEFIRLFLLGLCNIKCEKNKPGGVSGREGEIK